MLPDVFVFLFFLPPPERATRAKRTLHHHQIYDACLNTAVDTPCCCHQRPSKQQQQQQQCQGRRKWETFEKSYYFYRFLSHDPLVTGIIGGKDQLDRFKVSSMSRWLRKKTPNLSAVGTLLTRLLRCRKQKLKNGNRKSYLVNFLLQNIPTYRQKISTYKPPRCEVQVAVHFSNNQTVR